MPTDQRRPRILHLNGNGDTHQKVKEVTERALPNCELITVESGSQALRLLEDKSFDLVIVDPWAAEVNGFKICRHLAEHQPDVPVFFLANRPTMNGRKFAEAAGARAYYLEGDLDQLVDAITSVLEDRN